ncbi:MULTISPECIES: hydroxyacid dehydrogenase [Mesorhizobium]|uniref:Hydroxyacid dehydrogenase n=1 Tax=Mesorhizobium denitrificans TaxID=2294114 RepID=A0A371XI83_9HYPH|nr:MULTISPECIES: hydroxyacid dehydrogenase [Mesorhizobium]RFC68940.1 hydroxyacid dehydrogenase [Mesorhizobium denitrificans]
MTRKDFRIFMMAHPRKIEDIFEDADLARLHALGEVTINRGSSISDEEFNAQARDCHVIMGQFDMPAERLDQCPNLRTIINLEGNFLPNIDYKHCFRKGVRVLSVSHVFAEPVAEIAVGIAIDLGRGISRSDRLMRRREERWGLEANQNALSLYDAKVGFLGFGDLGRALLPLLKPFRTSFKIYDPWIPEMVIEQAGGAAAGMDEVLATSDFVFVLAGATQDNQGFLGAREFGLMRDGAAILLLSRASVVNFPEMLEVARSGRIKIATDVYPDEPLPKDDPTRDVENLLHSPHQAGALTSVLKHIGRGVASDVELVARGLPPMVCKQAQPETAARFRSKPVEQS